MATRHTLGSSSPWLALSRPDLGPVRCISGRVVHLSGMETSSGGERVQPRFGWHVDKPIQ